MPTDFERRSFEAPSASKRAAAAAPPSPQPQQPPSSSTLLPHLAHITDALSGMVSERQLTDGKNQNRELQNSMFNFDSTSAAVAATNFNILSAALQWQLRNAYAVPTPPPPPPPPPPSHSATAAAAAATSLFDATTRTAFRPFKPSNNNNRQVRRCEIANSAVWRAFAFSRFC